MFFSSNFLVLSADKAEGEDFNMGEMIMHHVLDDYQYEIMHGLVIPLPVILYTEKNGLLIFSSSNLSITDCFSSRSPLDKITKDILEIMNKAAITAVDLVKKFPTVLVDAKLSCDKPRPNAPPSDLCSLSLIHI